MILFILLFEARSWSDAGCLLQAVVVSYLYNTSCHNLLAVVLPFPAIPTYVPAFLGKAQTILSTVTPELISLPAPLGICKYLLLLLLLQLFLLQWQR